MKSFKEWILLEGGNAFAGKSSRINQDNVAATLETIYSDLLPKLGLSKKDTALLGSTGKKKSGESSGDIDIAIDTKILLFKNKSLKTLDDLAKFVNKEVNKFALARILPGNGIVSALWKIENIDGNQPDDRVQLDLMLSDDLSFASFMFHSPSSWESQWKGYYRNIMMSSISFFAQKEVKEIVDGEEAVWEKILLNYTNGMFKTVLSRKGKKGLLKNPKTLSRTFMTKSPDEIVNVLFGDSFHANDIMTWEDTLAAINSPKFRFKKIKSKIIDKFKENLTKSKIPYPDGV